MQQTRYSNNMNKKSVSQTLAIILIFVVAAFILLVFNSQLSDVFKGTADVETCRLSVLAQAVSKTVPIVGVDMAKSSTPLQCPRRLIKIYEDKVEVNGKKDRKYDFKKITDKEVNHVAAEELRNCWYMMAEGNKNVFEQSYFFSGGKYYTCLICSEIEFDEKLKGKTFEGLVDYLKSNKIPRGDDSYFDYLTKSQKELFLYLPYGQYYNPFGYGTTNKVAESKLSSDGKYLIYFLAMKPLWIWEKTRVYTSIYYIGLGKEDKLNEECSILVN